VLIVDDNAVNRRILHAQLTRWHTRPTAIDNGREALEVLTAAARAGDAFVLVILDVNMPDLDGFQVAEQIGARPELAGATIMMLSSSGQHRETARCRELGVAEYLAKPIQASDLHEAICRALRPASPQGAEPPIPPRQTPRAARALRVLLAEDNAVNQRVAVGLLSARGHDVTVAGNGVDAVAAAEHQRFDVILMDVQMPLMGGLDATAMIRERERQTGRHTRIVAMTAHAMTGDRERCLAAGMDGYLSKPIDPQRLYATLEQDAPSASPAVAVTSLHAAGPVARESLLARVGYDEDLLSDVIQVFLADCPKRLVAIHAAVQAGDPGRLREAAHALKGAAGNVSAAALFDAASTLERMAADDRLNAVEAVEAGWQRLSAEAARVMDALRAFPSSAPAEDTQCVR
jgi:CheY-like chemotaxis protein